MKVSLWLRTGARPARNYNDVLLDACKWAADHTRCLHAICSGIGLRMRPGGEFFAHPADALKDTDTPLNRTGVGEGLAEEGFTRQWPRPHAARGGPRKEPLTPAAVVDFSELARRMPTKLAGLYLAIPELVGLDLPGLVASAGYPGTRVIPAVSSILSLLALKLSSMRRISHVYDLAADPAAGLFAGL